MRSFFLIIFVYLIVACASQESKVESTQSSFVTLLGNDTLAIEKFGHVDGNFHAEVVLRSPRTSLRSYEMILNSGLLVSMEVKSYDPALGLSSEIIGYQKLYFEGDSLVREVKNERGTSVRKTYTDGNILPFIDMVHWPFDLAMTNAYNSGQDSIRQMLLAGSRARPFIITNLGEGNMTLRHPSRGVMEIKVDENGKLQELDAGATTRKLKVTRTVELDVESYASKYAEIEESGKTFGALSGRGTSEVIIGEDTIAVDFGRPLKRGRDIFGSLVKYGELWRTGANRATHFKTGMTIKIGDVEIPGGEYTLYSIPEAEGGTLVINTQTGQGGTTYNQDRDLARIPMQVRSLDEVVKLFTIVLELNGKVGELKLQWDQKEYFVRFEIID